MPNWNYNYYVYLLSNRYNTVIYTGVTNDLLARIWQHKTKAIRGFTSRYNANKLVYYEHFDHIDDAIYREKQIKAGSHRKKEELIESKNPSWKDLYNEIKN